MKIVSFEVGYDGVPLIYNKVNGTPSSPTSKDFYCCIHCYSFHYHYYDYDTIIVIIINNVLILF